MVSNQDANSIFTDPLFVDENKNDFHLYNTSKAVDAGNAAFTITANETDFENQSRIFNGKVDIGADENQGEFIRDTISLGIVESEENEISVYPNPCGDKLLVTGHKLLENTIEITNILGIVCPIPPFQRLQIPKESGGLGGLELNISTLSNGIYFLQLTDIAGKTYRKKFIKN
jgi:hypothetical protein